MPYVAFVTVAVLVQYIILGVLVGRARDRYGIAAPAVAGHEIFERHFRVQMNTLEQVVAFLPAMWIFATYVSPIWAAAAGVVFVIGRAIYARTYVRDPKTRSIGFLLTVLPTFALLIGILVWALLAIVRAPSAAL
jgi:glutathione S-transferase